MTKAAIIGWVIQSAGVVVCLYGYFSTGNPSIVDWHTIAPSWIADWLPNIQSEIGMTLMFAGMIPIYWPRRYKIIFAIDFAPKCKRWAACAHPAKGLRESVTLRVRRGSYKKRDRQSGDTGRSRTSR